MWPSMKNSLVPAWTGLRHCALTPKNLRNDEQVKNISTVAPPAVEKVRSTGFVWEKHADLDKPVAIDLHSMASIRPLEFGGNLTAKALASISTIRRSYIKCVSISANEDSLI